MEPAFAEAVDQVFVAALELLERISVGEAVSPADERTRMKSWIERAESMIDGTEEWELAKYALVCWIDSQMVHAPWDGAGFWDNNPLEMEFYFHRLAFTEFFVKAKRAGQMPKKNALEVSYLCVVFGFRGLYGPPPEDRAEGERPEDLDLPPDINSWAKQTATSLRVGASRSSLDFEPRPLDGAPALQGHRTMVLSLIASAIMIGLPVGLLLMKWLDKQ